MTDEPASTDPIVRPEPAAPTLWTLRKEFLQILILLAVVVIGCVLVSYDKALMDFFHDEVYLSIEDRQTRKWIIRPFKHFAEYIPLLVALALILLCDKKNGKRNAGRIVVAVLLAVATCGFFKASSGRARPSVAVPERTSEWYGPLVGWTAAEYQSFPSGHAAAAWAAAWVLFHFYPKVSPLTFLLAAAASASRVLTHKHFVSDVWFGIFIGILLTRWSVLRNWPYAEIESLVEKARQKREA